MEERQEHPLIEQVRVLLDEFAQNVGDANNYAHSRLERDAAIRYALLRAGMIHETVNALAGELNQLQRVMWRV